MPSALCLLALGAIQGGQEVRLNVYFGIDKIGQATFSQSFLRSGGKATEVRTNLERNGRKMSVVQTWVYDARGAPVRGSQETNADGRIRKVDLLFGGAGVAVEVEGNIKRVSLALNAPRAMKSEFWFLRDHPMADDSFQAYAFVVNDSEWVLRTTIFRGREITQVGDHNVEANHVVITDNDRRIDAYLDDQGLPFRIEDSGGLWLERVDEG